MPRLAKNPVLRALGQIRPWVFLTVAVVSGIVCVFSLRANNQHMVKLREAVYAADRDNTDVQSALKSLQIYVTSHMNTSLSSGTTVYPPIQLKNTYDRLVKAQTDEVALNNTQLYSEAQANCELQNSTDFSGRNRVPCIEEYVQAHSVDKTASIPDSLYKFSFISPTWSPDLAGFSMAIAVFSMLVFGLKLIISKL